MILRVDDICATTSPAELEQLYGDWWLAGYPVCFSVVPMSAYRFTVGGVVETDPKAIAENRELVEFLSHLIDAGLVEIALHGWEHHHGELTGDDVRTIVGKLERGLELLYEAFPDVAIQVLVPPHDYLSPAGVEAAKRLKLTVCSTWAAIHGGTRWAHYAGRMRQWLNLADGVSSAGIYTDSLLDFEAGQSSIEGATVIVQHPWRVMRRLEAWEAWKQAWLGRLDVRRYADVLGHRHHT